MALDPRKTFHNTFVNHLGTVLSKHSEKHLTRAVMIEIYQDIFNALAEIVQGAGVKLSNDGVNWLAQAYYDGLKIRSKGSEHELDPTIFDKRPSLDDMATTDLVILMSMTRGTGFQPEIVAVLKKRLSRRR